ncbi:MAG: heavy metal translocating P-type ATPase [Deltaproteobacteria bacterium]|jgi:Cd2+/Zn2+-exporting ATPase|nr:heavy metal translocating P-type ATPase [Deltaproteobacteria bacterium]
MNNACAICGQLHCQEHATAEFQEYDGSGRLSLAPPLDGSANEEESPSDDGEEAESSQAGGIGFNPPAIRMLSPGHLVSSPARNAEDERGPIAEASANSRQGQKCSDECCSSEDAAAVETEKKTLSCSCCGSESAPLTSDEASETEEKSPLNRLFLASALALGSEIGHFASAPQWLVILLAVVAVAVGGLSTWISGWKSLIKFRLDIMALMSAAVTGAALIGEFSEGALVLVLFTLAEALEDRSVARARKAIAALLQLAPEKATVRENESWVERPAAEVPQGALVRVRPGEKLALDGTIVSGASAFDQSPITGESAPADKGVGDAVFAGTMNMTGVVDYEVSAAYGDSALSRIVKTVEEAEKSKAPVERFVSRFAAVYTPAVFVLAVLAAVIPPLALDGLWSEWIPRALALLVISCPCALVVSTPVAILSALAAATKAGLLVKGGAFLEEGRRLKVLALDKTGTITSGKPRRTDFLALNGFEADLADQLSGSLASLSKHPISQAIAYASTHKDRFVQLTNFADLPGLGVSAEWNGKKLALGSAALMTSLGLMDEELKRNFQALENQGKSVVALAVEQKVVAVIAAADAVKEDSRRTSAELTSLGVTAVMLTGDNGAAAAAAAAAVGLDDVRSSLMPEDKLACVEELSKMGKVGMVGDGINDAPALARADIGFSMGAAGSGAAIETADVAVMDDNLAKIPAFIRLSRAVHKIFVQNIVFILMVKLVFITVALAGHASMWMAVLADIGVCLIVMANSLRLAKTNAEKNAGLQAIR